MTSATERRVDYFDAEQEGPEAFRRSVILRAEGIEPIRLDPGCGLTLHHWLCAALFGSSEVTILASSLVEVGFQGTAYSSGLPCRSLTTDQLNHLRQLKLGVAPTWAVQTTHRPEGLADDAGQILTQHPHATSNERHLASSAKPILTSSQVSQLLQAGILRSAG